MENETDWYDEIDRLAHKGAVFLIDGVIGREDVIRIVREAFEAGRTQGITDAAAEIRAAYDRAFEAGKRAMAKEAAELAKREASKRVLPSAKYALDKYAAQIESLASEEQP